MDSFSWDIFYAIRSVCFSIAQARATGSVVRSSWSVSCDRSLVPKIATSGQGPRRLKSSSSSFGVICDSAGIITANLNKRGKSLSPCWS